jgi:hypothetical protein
MNAARTVKRTLAGLLALAMVVTPLRALAQTPAPTDPAAADVKKRAQGHFEQGVKLFESGAVDPALSEFLASRALFPTRAATTNAAACLSKLGRFDEALDMYDAYLKEFPSAPADERERMARDRASAQALVGTVEVRTSETEASVTVDGRERGKTPLGALHVASGTRVIRVYKDGFAPFEARVQVAGNQSLTVNATLKALTESGRLKVSEASGQQLSIVVDGIVVGQTPWEGPLEVGEHTIFLRGPGVIGTQPVTVVVQKNAVAPLSLAAEALDASVRVAPTPGGASVAIDGVVVGRGVWDGRLRVGRHRIEVAAEGFLAQKSEIELGAGARQSLAIGLERDPDSPMWREGAKPKVTFELDADMLLSTTVGGQIVTGCTGRCSRGLALGGAARAHATYQTRSGFALGGYLGYAGLGQSVEGRPTALTAVGLPSAVGTSDDSVTAHAAHFGIAASYRRGQKLAWMARLSVGMILGGAFVSRQGTFSNGATSFPAGPVDEGSALGYLAVLPEGRVAYRLGEHVELSAGVVVYALIATSQPRWRDAKLTRTPDGFATYGETTSMGSFTLFLAPSLGARYDF